MFSASIWLWLTGESYSPLAGSSPAKGMCRGVRARSSSLRSFQRVVDDVTIGAEPIGFLDELAALHLEDLHPAAALVIGWGDFERRNEPVQRKSADLFEALLDVSPGRRFAARQFQSVADPLDMDRRLEQPAVVIDRVLVHQVERLLALLFVFRLDLLANGIVVAGAGELHRVVAFRDAKAARRVDVGLGCGPHQTDDLRQRIAVGFESLDRGRRRPAKEMRD